jgi:hydrogenase maturation protease
MGMSWTKPDAIEQQTKVAHRRPLIAIIGCGNTLRRDDGAGIALAHTLAALWEAAAVPTLLIVETQLLPEMAAIVAAEGVEAVVFVDAGVGNRTQDIHFEELFVDLPTASSCHHVDPTTLLVYTGLLYDHYPRAWVVTVPGNDFAHGEGFSPEVSALLNNSATLAATLLATIEEKLSCMN